MIAAALDVLVVALCFDLQRIAVAKLSEQEIMDLLDSHGIVKMSAKEAQPDRQEPLDHEDL